MSDAGGLAGELLARPGFADRTRQALIALVEEADVAAAAIAAAEAEITGGAGAQRVAFDLLAAHPGVESAAVFGELSSDEADYLWAALDVPGGTWAALVGVVDGLARAEGLGRGIRATTPSLAELRVIGEVEIDFGAWPFETLHRVDVAAVRGRRVHGFAGHPDALRRMVHGNLVSITRAFHRIASDVAALEWGDLGSTPGSPERVAVERIPLAEGTALVTCVLGRLEAAFLLGGVNRARARALARLTLDGGNLTPTVWGVPRRRRRAGGRSPREQALFAVLRPVFGQTFGLVQIHQPLRARVRGVSPGELHPEAAPGGHGGQRVVDTSRALDAWVHEARPDDALRVISGGPGAGKSSLARMFVARMWRQPGRVVHIPLHAFDLDDDLTRAINRFAHDARGWQLDVLPPIHVAPLTLVFDGLDELAAGGRVASRAVETLFDGVERLLALHNTDGTLRLRALLLGREVVVQAHEARCRRPGQVLHLLPYRIPDELAKDLDDPDGLLAHDQRHDWWRRYGELTGQPFEGLPPELDRDRLVDLTSQPLLNLLVALAREGGLEFDGTVGLPAVYADLVRQVFERTHSASGRLEAVADVSLDDYVQFLEAVAVAAWHGGGRTATVAEIEAVAGRRLLGKMKALRAGAEEGIGRLITVFYFRSVGDSEQGRVFEFTHQSFAEALLARRIMRFLGRLERQVERWEQDDDGWDMTTRLVEWYRLFGPAPLDPNAVKFVRDELAAIDGGVAERWRSALVPMLQRVMIEDWPIEAAGPRAPFAVEVRRGRHASSALLAVVDALARRVGQQTALGEAVQYFSGWWSALRRDGSLDAVICRATGSLDASAVSGFLNFSGCDDPLGWEWSLELTLRASDLD